MTTDITFNENWERRWHPLLREWVILAATTSERPWSGETISSGPEENPVFDPDCYLCPGVTRASGKKNPEYQKPFAFTNDFASFSLEAPDVHRHEPFEIVEPAHGICRVICFTPRHNITLAEMSREELLDVVNIWKKEFDELGRNPAVKNVLIFENKGKVIGVSNPHPHGQIYATGYVPKVVQRELDSFIEHKVSHGKGLLEELVEHELKKGTRIICRNEHFVAFIPFFARFVYETYIVPRRHIAQITDLTEEETQAYAEIHHQMIVRFDNLYNMSFPNITMLHNAPTSGEEKNRIFHFHTEFYPPMRSPDKLKYLAGFESGGGNIINPVKPEEAADRLRQASTIHYKYR
ncbi:MAG: galactose-1-phosphate uridylyltransferase [Bacteroidales bacterium]|nr:galactose-1-phosphate uridylyltransferase [Bacteroidales bacterium]MBN2762416.1 galactose-1-phosphate uridylyltransferase [Bacteroidales bacterium]